MILKGDNEKPLLKLLRVALASLRIELADAAEEHPPDYDSQASGGTEVGVRIVRGQFRTLRVCLQRRIGKKIPLGHPVLAWLLEHATVLLNARVRGSDGLTPWARAAGGPSISDW